MKRLIARAIVPAATLAVIFVYPGRFHASQDWWRAETDGHVRYNVVHLSSLGGTSHRGNSINAEGWVTGFSSLRGNTSRHATLWARGFMVDLGTLGGPNSNVAWPVKNTIGLIAGIAQTDQPQPFGETWSCRDFFPGPDNTRFTCRGVVWEWGKIRALPTLGGDNSFATGANNRHQVVGWAENTVHDPTCEAPQILQFHAVIWGPGEQQIVELLPLRGTDDTSTAATAINDDGQVVGISGTCDQAVGRRTAKHAVLWEKGRMTDLGNLGAELWNTPMAINEHGDVVGFAGTPGDDPTFPAQLRAFSWTKRRGMQPLRPLDGHLFSQANGINARGQVVGTSCPPVGNCHAVLWEDGVPIDLVDLTRPEYTNLLTSAQDITDEGVITGRALIEATNMRPAFVATPVRRR
jgi:probable HAF family extracellular repeat protein